MRKEAKDDRALIRSEVDEHVFILMDHVRNRVTRKEFEDEQNFFHRTMTTWVIEEIDTNRRSVLEKINTISARMAGELEELTGMGGVEECVAKVQEITSHVSSLSDSLWEHKLQIERNAEKLVELGANAAQIAEIKENFKELKKKTQSTLIMIRAKLESQRTNSVSVMPSHFVFWFSLDVHISDDFPCPFPLRPHPFPLSIPRPLLTTILRKRRWAN